MVRVHIIVCTEIKIFESLLSETSSYPVGMGYAFLFATQLVCILVKLKGSLVNCNYYCM